MFQDETRINNQDVKLLSRHTWRNIYRALTVQEHKLASELHEIKRQMRCTGKTVDVSELQFKVSHVLMAKNLFKNQLKNIDDIYLPAVYVPLLLKTIENALDSLKSYNRLEETEIIAILSMADATAKQFNELQLQRSRQDLDAPNGFVLWNIIAGKVYGTNKFIWEHYYMCGCTKESTAKCRRIAK